MESSATTRATDMDELTQTTSSNLTPIEASRAVRVHGADNDGNSLVILTPVLVPDMADAWELAFQHFLQVTGDISKKPYRIIYVHSGFASTAWLAWWLRGLRARVPQEYRANLAALTVLHPTLAVRGAFLAARAVYGGEWWERLEYADRIEEIWLDGVLEREAVEGLFGDDVREWETELVREAEEWRRIGVRFGAPVGEQRPT